MKTFNLNNHVWVKLTPKGEKILFGERPEEASGNRYLSARGWTRLQLWEVLAYLGPNVTFGSAEPLAMTIRFEAPPEWGPICDTCGEPSTHAARDFRKGVDWSGLWETCEPVGDVKSGCSEHPVRSKEVT
jgi:hypothetical protein